LSAEAAPLLDGVAGRALRVLHVNTSDLGGGAEAIARSLCRAARGAGHEAWLAVGDKLGTEPYVLTLPGARRRGRLARGLSDPWGLIEHALGREDFRHPGTWHLEWLLTPPPDVLHLHNLHGGYFDLRALTWLSRRWATFVTLHDPWLLTGHCAHPFGCGRWQIGCGECPDLATYPAVRRDATAYNWRRKHDIYEGSHLHVAAPSRWILSMVERSMLRTAVHQLRWIPNGIDLDLFCPGERDAARQELGLSPAEHVVLLAAKGLRQSPYRDWRTLRQAIGRIAQAMPDRPLRFIALGEAEPERIDGARIDFVPYEPEPGRVATYLRAADLFVHATRADTFPSVVLEAGACGIPVVASAVGGILDQVESGRTGLLVPPEDAEGLARGVTELLDDRARREALGRQAAAVVRERFGAERMSGSYLRWYEEVLRSRCSGVAVREERLR
jgi:glycosyltransferase involved in cell wall biosynthesis